MISSHIDLDPQTRGILLDIEGTTSSISFVHDVMFPFVRQHLSEYLAAHWDSSPMKAVRAQMAADDGAESWEQWLSYRGVDAQDAQAACQQRIIELMDADAKITGLKQLQGLIWESGFQSGQLRSHVYPDVLPAIESWRRAGRDVRIYSSGSVAAQRLFFGHVAGHGDCLTLFSGHYDTTIGNKRQSESYQRIAQDWKLQPGQILFVSDLEPELEAAAAAGLQVIASIRPGNAPLLHPEKWRCVTGF